MSSPAIWLDAAASQLLPWRGEASSPREDGLDVSARGANEGRGRRRTVLAAAATLAAVVVAAGAIAELASLVGTGRFLVAAALALFLVIAGFGSPTRLLVLVIVWLAVMGTVRRVLPSDGTTLGDPLLLVAPAILALLAGLAIKAGALRRWTAVSTCVALFSLLSLLEALNPKQGSLATGFAGLLFFLVPQLGFWIGRGLIDDAAFTRLFKVIAGIAPLVAIYGLIQSFGVFPIWDRQWVQTVADSGYQALFVNGVLRAFASLSSASEYSAFIATGGLAWLAFGIRGRSRLLVVAVIGLIGAALVLESSRGILVLFVLAIATMVACRRGLPLPVALGVGAALILATPMVSALLVPSGSGGLNDLLQHQFQGLADPFGSSTLLIHTGEFTGGISGVLNDPFGLGVAAVSIAGQKFGAVTAGTEVDPSNAAVALGLAGLILYLLIVVLGVRMAYRLALVRRDPASLLAVGVLVVILGQWLNGGQYAVAFLPWLALGWADRTLRDTQSSAVPGVLEWTSSVVHALVGLRRAPSAGTEAEAGRPALERRVRVTLVAHDVREMGGMDRVFAELIRRASESVEFTLVSTTLMEELRSLVRWRQVRVLRRPAALKFVAFFIQAGLEVARNRGDLVHTMGPIIPNRVDVVWVQHCWAGVRSRSHGLAPPGAPVLTRLNTTIANAVALWAERWVCRSSRARVLAASSNMISGELAEYYPTVPRTLVPNGVDLDVFRPSPSARKSVRRAHGVGPGDIVLLFVGGDWHRKGLDLAVKALALARNVCEQRLLLWVVGKGDEQFFAALARDCGVGDAVAFTIAPPDVTRFYHAADVFLLPSVYEGFSLVALEAAASGLPVIGTPVGCVGELLDDGKAGISVSRTPEAIAEAVVRIVHDQVFRKAAGRVARERAAHYSWERSVSAMTALYEQLVNTTGSAATISPLPAQPDLELVATRAQIES